MPIAMPALKTVAPFGRLCVLLFLCVQAIAQNDTSLYQRKLYIHNGDTLPYRMLLPQNYDATQYYPLILMLHGSGERGSDNNLQLVHGGSLFVQPEVRTRFPAIVVFPQCPAKSFWSNVDIKTDSSGKRSFNYQTGGKPTVAMDLANRLLHSLIDEYSVAKDQVYVGGLSMGGMGTFEIVRRNAKLFAAAMPICGGAAPATAEKLKRVHWWVFHGAKDDVVPPVNSERMVTALKKQNADVQFTLYPNANHNSWDSAFAEPNLLPWLFSQKKK